MRVLILILIIPMATLSGCRRFEPELEIEVPTIEAVVGCSPRLRACPLAAPPARTVNLRAFLIDETEVTQRRYAACVDVNSCTALRKPSGDDEPALATYRQAESYCAWRGKRLPTEDEWEVAGRGSELFDYSWGDQPPTCMDAKFRAGCEFPDAYATVKSFTRDRSTFGVFDMVGNAPEWVADVAGSAPTRSEHVVKPAVVVRPMASALYYRESWPDFSVTEKYRNQWIGFRCARTGKLP